METVQLYQTAGLADVFARLDEILPEIRSRRREIEESRKLPRDLVDKLTATGVFRLGVPRDLGGEQARQTDLMRAIEKVAAADGSTGWCVMLGVTGSTASGMLKEAGAREMFADPAKPSAGIAAPTGQAKRVDGGVRVSGRWAFGSGITHSEWMWISSMVMENGKPRMTAHGPEIIQTALRVDEGTIHDTWYVSGLCGTGSQDFSVEDVFVPDDRIFALMDASTHRSEALYQMPPLATFAAQVVGVSLGIARAALDELVELAQKKVPSLYTAVLAERAVVQTEVARAEAALAAARAAVYQAVEDVFGTVEAGRQPTQRQIAMLRLATLHGAETGAQIARTANILAGGSAIYAGSSLQRHARDAEVILHHFTLAPMVWEEAGRILLGRQPLSLDF